MRLPTKVNGEKNTVTDLPRLTVVMPNFNDSEFIGRAIESVLSQTYPGLEFIVVDDGSTDNPVEIIRSYGDAITLVCHEKNRGQPAAVNTGLRLAQGEIVNWLNSNDTFEPEVLLKLGGYFAQHPDVDVVFGDFNIIDVHDRVLLRQRVLPLDYTLGCLIGFGNLIAVNTMFMRRSVLETVGLLDETFRYVPDNDFLFRLASRYEIKKLDWPIANWRRHPTSHTVRGQSSYWEAYQAEIDRAVRASYNSLPISRLIPYEYSAALRAIYRIKRVFQRAVRLHYLAYIPMWMDSIRRRWASWLGHSARRERSKRL